jgi:hypothetical protein
MDADRGLGDQGSAEIKTGSGERRRMRPLCGSPLHVAVRLLLALCDPRREEENTGCAARSASMVGLTRGLERTHARKLVDEL